MIIHFNRKKRVSEFERCAIWNSIACSLFDVLSRFSRFKVRTGDLLNQKINQKKLQHILHIQ